MRVPKQQEQQEQDDQEPHPLMLQQVSVNSTRLETDVAPVQWALLLTSLPVFSLAVCHFCHEWAVYTVAYVIPLYLHEELHLDVKQASYSSISTTFSKCIIFGYISAGSITTCTWICLLRSDYAIIMRTYFPLPPRTVINTSTALQSTRAWL